MSQEEVKAAVVRNALRICEERINNKSGTATPEIMKSIRNQLRWLVSYFEGKNSERVKLSTLVFGQYAAREVDGRDEEFTDALYKAAYVADQTAKGLKIDHEVIKSDS